MKTATGTVVCAAVLALAVPALSAPAAPRRHRAFWDISVGPVITTNVYRDRSDEGDLGYDGRVRLGLRSRYSARTFSQLQYLLDTVSFPEVDVENRADHGLEGLFRHRLSDPLTLETKAGVRWSRYPNVTDFNNTTLFGQAALKGYLTSRTTLEGGLAYEKKSYPDFDLDYGGVGLFGTLAHDFGRRTFGELSGAYRNEDYSERQLLNGGQPDAADEAPRSDRDWLVGARVVRDLSLTLQLEALYQYGRVSSNGDSLDFGPFQSPLVDVPGDERLIVDYYSHRRHELGARLRKLIRRGSSVTVAARYQDRSYLGRLARDEEERFLSPEETRRDRGIVLSAILDIPFPLLARRVSFGHFGLRLRLSRELNHSNEALYDYGNSVASVTFTSWF